MFVLQPQGETTEAIAQFRKAVELDPLTDSRRLALAYGLLRNGENQEALAIASALLTRNPGDELTQPVCGARAVRNGKAHRGSRNPGTIGASRHTGTLVTRTPRWADRAEAEAIAAEPDPAAARHQALIYAGLGDATRCVAALRAVAGANDYAADLYPGEPELATLQNDPQMREFRSCARPACRALDCELLSVEQVRWRRERDSNPKT